MLRLPRLLAACLALCWLGLSSSAATTSAIGDPPPTNVLVIFMDDVGKEQLACYDSDHGIRGLTPGDAHYTTPYDYPSTPHITRLAREGIRFTRAFTAPLCTPSRGQIQTGRYPFRNRIGTIVREHGINGPIDLSPCEVILPEMLLAAPTAPSMGYFGKWHLARSPCLDIGFVPGNPQLSAPGDSHPTDMGWPFFQGILANPQNDPNPQTAPGVANGECPGYFNWFRITSPSPPGCSGDTGCTPDPQAPADPCTQTPAVPTSVCREVMSSYITIQQREDVSAWILAQDENEPWMCFWSTTAVHRLFEWPPGGEGSLHSYGIQNESNQIWLRYLAVMESLDTEIGKLRDTLSERPAGGGPSIWDRTLVILMGDNGTDRGAVRNGDQNAPGLMLPYIETNGPPARFKGTPYVTGTNVPLIISGPALLVSESLAGQTEDALIDAVDVFDTLRDVFGLPANPTVLTNPIDGVSFLPLLQGFSQQAPRTESLALSFAPNGCFPPTPPAATPNAWEWEVKIGYLKVLDNDMGGTIETGTYRMIYEKSNDGDPQIEEFYKLFDDQGANVDPLEAIPLDISVNGAYRAEYEAVCSELNALLAQPHNACCEPCTTFTPEPICFCPSCP